MEHLLKKSLHKRYIHKESLNTIICFQMVGVLRSHIYVYIYIYLKNTQGLQWKVLLSVVLQGSSWWRKSHDESPMASVIIRILPDLPNMVFPHSISFIEICHGNLKSCIILILPHHPLWRKLLIFSRGWAAASYKFRSSAKGVNWLKPSKQPWVCFSFMISSKRGFHISGPGMFSTYSNYNN